MELTQQSYHFRENKDTGVKRESVVVENYPLYGAEDIITALNDDDERIVAFVTDAVNALVNTAARKQVDDNEAITELDTDALTFEKLAYMPKAQRGYGITKEQWDEFRTDYVTTMVTVFGKGQDQAEKAASIIAAKFTPVKGRNDIIEILSGFVNEWFGATENASKLSNVYEYLTDRADQLLTEDKQDLADFL